ncbi:unnamed protein product, partial [Vitis vinifera]
MPPVFWILPYFLPIHLVQHKCDAILGWLTCPCPTYMVNDLLAQSPLLF